MIRLANNKQTLMTAASRRIRPSSIFTLICSVLLLTVSAALAQPAPARPSEKRFLLVIETSSQMKKMAASTEESISALIESGMGGLMENGDTLGIWTFNRDFHAGEFPIQRWETNSSA